MDRVGFSIYPPKLPSQTILFRLSFLDVVLKVKDNSYSKHQSSLGDWHIWGEFPSWVFLWFPHGHLCSAFVLTSILGGPLPFFSWALNKHLQLLGAVFLFPPWLQMALLDRSQDDFLCIVSIHQRTQQASILTTQSGSICRSTPK